ncbi:16S rRNA (cytosine(1402)-N(4))-methyltransferase RsmH [Mycoplasma flocculare]|uniref:Ribosomal RNA small subunit methyltransferase H n=2 Tax=Mesomycoplasma flocculare TaxID=2128 RepID=A0A0A8E788_MESFC|nr:16S rRNA (cytosine(1402)-N(4))-methyltransferase RsmH [Mesomycoplasma flocculare]MXR39509.1 16S rRNA (cytosine(1402)-N(4))-methyltransferase RsmH [Mycoplasma sp. MF12]AJC49849.1 ribosomal RNA small subunit methyltransferase H (MraW) [Mesomycoplasma flocculare ATCC 27399]ENX51185.1 S-adenosyl-methyltransferase [Mesomycoplasma flocculare ATCC 27716]MXR05963.1 16S rRNA (cytosine(1402)-N(4))-methyltransferase RsmH [Mesomycoplasma flocculare]MXR12330.1 16S rRNA (cytosine(1402)-N(4))-methyltransf
MHIPVLLEELILALQVNPKGFYVDLTLGRGGHSLAILEKLTTGKLFVFDKDQQALTETKAKLLAVSQNVEFIWSDFSDFDFYLKKLGVEFVDGFVVDLGVSSPQIDDPERGFSYSKNCILDMRMDKSQKLNAFTVLNEYPSEKLVEIFFKYGQISYAREITKAIVASRPLKTTFELVNLVKKVIPALVFAKKNFIKNVFQAVRIEVNNELDSLQKLLEKLPKFLKQGSKVAIISFHSLEDKIVKDAFLELVNKDKLEFFQKGLPKFSMKVFRPKTTELNKNPRSKSAKLRILTKN